LYFRISGLLDSGKQDAETLWTAIGNTTIARTNVANVFTVNQTISGSSALILNNSNAAIWWNGSCLNIVNGIRGISVC